MAVACSMWICGGQDLTTETRRPNRLDGKPKHGFKYMHYISLLKQCMDDEYVDIHVNAGKHLAKKQQNGLWIRFEYMWCETMTDVDLYLPPFLLLGTILWVFSRGVSNSISGRLVPVGKNHWAKLLMIIAPSSSILGVTRDLESGILLLSLRLHVEPVDTWRPIPPYPNLEVPQSINGRMQPPPQHARELAPCMSAHVSSKHRLGNRIEWNEDEVYPLDASGSFVVCQIYTRFMLW